MGPSTIVGSASFNLLVISGVSIYAVNEANDTNDDRDESMEPGIKKIKDMGVFGITASFSVFAYLWLFFVLYDQKVYLYEGLLTFSFFFVLLALAFGADKYNQKDDEEDNDDIVVNQPIYDFSAV